MAADTEQDQIAAELLNRLVQTTPDHAVFLLYPDAKIRWCNAAAESMFALSAEEIIGQPFHVLFTPEDRALGIPNLEVAIAASSVSSVDDRWHLRGDGTKFWSSGVLVRITDASGTVLGFGKLIRDRTDMKTQFDLAVNQREQLDAENRNKDRAITSLSHELRNVIAGMRGSMELLDRPADDEAMRTKLYGLMQRQLGMIERLVEDLLDVKRVASGAVALNCESLVLQQELRACIDRFAPQLNREQMELEFLAPTAEIVVSADRVRLQQIFGNLLDNAIKYTPKGGKVWVKLTTEDELAVVHLEDTGRGIPHEMLESIFELFTQVDSSASSGGLGVGLALVRELTLLHRGSVQASSLGLGTGSEFTVRLPLERVGAAP